MQEDQAGGCCNNPSKRGWWLGSRCCHVYPPPGAVPSLQAAPAPMSPSASCEKWEDCWIYFERSTRIYWGFIYLRSLWRGAGRTHLLWVHVELDGLGLCLSLWEISEGRTCYLLLDLEITGFFFPWSLLSPGCCQREAREEESYGLKSCCHYCCYIMEWRVICSEGLGSIWLCNSSSLPWSFEGLSALKNTGLYPLPKGAPSPGRKWFDTKVERWVELLDPRKSSVNRFISLPSQIKCWIGISQRMTSNTSVLQDIKRSYRRRRILWLPEFSKCLTRHNLKFSLRQGFLKPLVCIMNIKGDEKNT